MRNDASTITRAKVASPGTGGCGPGEPTSTPGWPTPTARVPLVPRPGAGRSRPGSP